MCVCCDCAHARFHTGFCLGISEHSQLGSCTQCKLPLKGLSNQKLRKDKIMGGNPVLLTWILCTCGYVHEGGGGGGGVPVYTCVHL